MTPKTKGILCCMTSGILFSLGGICVKLIPWNAMAINASRHLISLVIVGAYLLLTKHKFHVNKMIILGSMAMAATHIFYTYATKLTAAGNAIVLEYTSPIFVILIMLLVFKQKPNRLDLITCAFVFAGIVCFFIESISGGNALGNAFGLAAGICYASFYIISTREKADPLVGLFFGNVICVLVGLPQVLKIDAAAQTSQTWLALLVLGVFQVAVANIFLAHGLGNTPPVTANLLNAIEPILNPILVALIYHEYLSTLAIIGFVIVLVTVLVYNVKKIKA